MLFSIETHITCEFSGGVGFLPPSGSAHELNFLHGHVCSITVFKLDENAIRNIPLNTEHFIIDMLSTLDTLNSIGLGKNVSSY